MIAIYLRFVYYKTKSRVCPKVWAVAHVRSIEKTSFVGKFRIYHLYAKFDVAWLISKLSNSDFGNDPKNHVIYKHQHQKCSLFYVTVELIMTFNKNIISKYKILNKIEIVSSPTCSALNAVDLNQKVRKIMNNKGWLYWLK